MPMALPTHLVRIALLALLLAMAAGCASRGPVHAAPDAAIASRHAARAALN